MSRATFHIICLAVFSLCLISCEHKELCYNHPHTKEVEVTFDWSRIGSPADMNVIFYPAEGEGKPWEFYFPEGSDRTVKIPDGYWNIVCYNDNTENLMFRDTESWHGFTAVPKGVTAPDDEPCVYAPDMLFGYSIAECALTRFVSKSSDKIVLTPLPMTGTYSFEITGIRGLKNIAEISGSLSGMGKSLTMSSDTIESAGTLYFPGRGDKETDIITGEFRTFGPYRNGVTGSEHIFRLFLKSRSGKTYIFQEDVSGQISAVPLSGHIHDVRLVIAFDYEIGEDPIGGEGGGGFDPDTDEWDDEEKDIIL